MMNAGSMMGVPRKYLLSSCCCLNLASRVWLVAWGKLGRRFEIVSCKNGGQSPALHDRLQVLSTEVGRQAGAWAALSVKAEGQEPIAWYEGTTGERMHSGLWSELRVAEQ